VEINFGVGLAYYDIGDFANSLKHNQKVVQLEPNHLNAYNNIGRIYLNQFEEYEESIDAFSFVAENKPKGEKGIAYFNIGIANERMGNKDAAVESYTKAGEDGYDMGWVNLGVFASTDEDFEKAAEYYQKAIDTNPYNGLQHRNLGITYEDMGKISEARSVYESALGTVPADADGGLSYNYARLIEAQYPNERDKAIMYYLNDMSVNPGQNDSWFFLAGIFTQQQDFYKLKMVCQQAEPYFSSDPDLYFYYGAANYYSGDEETGMNMWKKAARSGSETARGILDANGIEY
jgi:tetratricopeptide (TPR) repeat protein